MYYPGQVSVEKEESQLANGEDNHKSHPDPFLYTDSKIMTGQGKAIICAVGDSTLLAKSRRPEDLKIEEQNTDLEKKLTKVSDQLSKYALAATILSVITHLFFQILLVMISD